MLQPGLGRVEDLLRAAAPGIDVYFDCVGGDHLEAALRPAPLGRVALCGPSLSTGARARPANLFQATANDLTLRGFRGSSHLHRMGDMMRDVSGWLADGRLRYRETIVDGLERAQGARADAGRRDDRQDAGADRLISRSDDGAARDRASRSTRRRRALGDRVRRLARHERRRSAGRCPRPDQRAPVARDSLADRDDGVRRHALLAGHRVPQRRAVLAETGERREQADRAERRAGARAAARAPRAAGEPPKAAPGVATVIVSKPARTPSSTALARPPAEPVVHHEQAATAQAPADRGRRRRALDARQVRQELGAADRDHDLVEARRGRPRGPASQPRLDAVRVLEPPRRSPAAPPPAAMRAAAATASCPPIASRASNSTAPARPACSALEPGWSRRRSPPAAGGSPARRDERRGRPAIGAGRPQLRLTEHREHQVERGPRCRRRTAGCRRTPAEQLARHVGIGDQRAPSSGSAPAASAASIVSGARRPARSAAAPRPIAGPADVPSRRRSSVPCRARRSCARRREVHVVGERVDARSVGRQTSSSPIDSRTPATSRPTSGSRERCERGSRVVPRPPCRGSSPPRGTGRAGSRAPRAAR